MIEFILHTVGICPDSLGHSNLLYLVGMINWLYVKSWFDIYIWRKGE